MATVVMAPERHSRPLKQKKIKRPRSSNVGPLPKQAACVAILVLAAVATIALSLEAAIFLRTHLLPRLSSPMQPLTYPFSHYMVFGYLWLILVLFLGVEGLYTRRRSIWNEVGHLTKAVGLGLIAFLAAIALSHLSLIISRSAILITGVNLLILLPIARY